MNRKQIMKWGKIGLLTIVLLCILLAVRSYLGQEVHYVQYNNWAAQTQILFVGNSYTYSNRFPKMFSELAEAGGHNVSVAMLAQGGWTLEEHVHSKVTRDHLQEQHWDYVVLQEQSVLPTSIQDRERKMYPAVSAFIIEIDKMGGEGILFMTWGRRDGLRASSSGDFQTMQAELKEGYLAIANELDVIVSPVGIAWQRAIESDPQLDLWVADGSHPNVKGSYLAACVFYVVIFGESPEGLAYTGKLDQETAQFLQSVAAETVFDDLELWNLK